jgi:ABC-type polysaccharide/polyol phosphate transport system ATPase subunit
MSKPAIVVNNVWRKYKIYQDKPTTLKEKILYRSKGVFQEKWVLQDISVTIEQGKMVGLIGRNGSGKSTLLKILTKILQPDKGTVEIYGRVSSLLELGAGFHMDFTGRENIYMNASIFGLSKKEIDKKIDGIIKFSELEAYIDNPVRTYSSGMYMRLAFSIAIHVDPDVLLIDEILAVGDAAFQKKCIAKIEEFKRLGKTIVFVSHDNGTMERLCDEVYWIHESKVKLSGNPHDVIREYLDFLTDTEEKRLTLEEEQKNNETINSESTEVKNKSWGNKAVVIKSIKVMDNAMQTKHIFEKGKPMIIQLEYEMRQAIVDNPAFGFGFFRNDGAHCYGTNTYIEKIDPVLMPKGLVNIKIDALNLVEGQYYVNVACHHIDGTPYDYITEALTFQVHSHEADRGIAYIPHKWEFEGVKRDE